MSRSHCYQLCIVATAAVAFFVNLGATRLWDQDEAYFARTAVEMHQRHEWVVPYFNDELFAHKPPFMFWMMRIGFLIFGVTEFAARFWSAAFGLATALLVYRLGQRLFNAQVGLWAGLAISTALMFDVVARAATPDCFLVFFSTLALYAFVRSQRWDDINTAIGSDLAPRRLPWKTCALMYASMGAAVLVKGPIGILLPGMVIGLFLLVRDPIAPLRSDATFGDRITLFLRRFGPGRILHTVWIMRPITAIAAVALVAGPWFAIVGWHTGGQFLREFFGTHNFGRFAGPMDNHGGPIWYYIPVVLAGFFPWSIFGIPTTIDLVRRCRGRDTHRQAAKFVACWIVAYIGFFSIAGTKLPNYVLPAYAALALATASFVDRWLSRPESVHRLWPRLSFGSLMLVGLTIAVAIPAVTQRAADGRLVIEKLGAAPEVAADLKLLIPIGILLVISGGLAIVLAEFGRRKSAAATLTVTATAFCVGLLGVVAVGIDQRQPSPAVADAIRHHSTSAMRVAQFGYFRPSLVYYTDTRVDHCKTPQAVADHLSKSSDSFLVTTEAHYTRLAPQLPSDIVVVSRHPEFPRPGTVVVLGRNPSLARRK